MNRSVVVAEYVRKHVRIKPPQEQVRLFPLTAGRFEKAFLLLPDEALDLFLSGARSLVVDIAPDPGLPLGMKTQTSGPASGRHYEIVIYHEHLSLPEDLFIAAFLRELGHVVAERPPEDEWPMARGDRSRFKERLENRADAMVWRWGLKHYNLRFLYATYPEHRVEHILTGINEALLEDDIQQ